MKLDNETSVLFICVAIVAVTFLVTVSSCEKEKMRLQYKDSK